MAVFTPAGKLVLWGVEHVIRFTTAGSRVRPLQTVFNKCYGMKFGLLRLPLNTFTLSSIFSPDLIFYLPPTFFIGFVYFSLATLSSLHIYLYASVCVLL